MDSSRNSWLRNFLVIFVGQAFLYSRSALSTSRWFGGSLPSPFSRILSYTASLAFCPKPFRIGHRTLYRSLGIAG